MQVHHVKETELEATSIASIARPIIATKRIAMLELSLAVSSERSLILSRWHGTRCEHHPLLPLLRCARAYTTFLEPIIPELIFSTDVAKRTGMTHRTSVRLPAVRARAAKPLRVQ